MALRHSKGKPTFNVLTNRPLYVAMCPDCCPHCCTAHRAGTTGCLLLMHKTGLGADQATRMAQAARPVINPIGGLPKLLRAFETDRVQQ